MDLKKKKIIAREFLLFFLCVITVILTYGGIYSYNFIKKKNTVELSQQLKTKQAELDSLRKTFQVQLDEFGIPIKKIDLAEFDLSAFDDPYAEFGGQTLSSMKSNSKISTINKQLSRIKFAKIVKAKYPEYGDVDDEGLTTKMLEKYPEYRSVIEGERTYLPRPPKKQSSLPSDQIPIYELLLDNGLTSKNKASFYEEYTDVKKQRKLYNFMIENSLTTKNFNQFSVDNFQSSGKINDLPSLEDLGLEKSDTALSQKINSLQKGVNTIWFIHKEESKTILNSRQINKATLNIFLICLAVIFGLRYLWYAINWSVKTIKS
ncbi:hypothetical protein FA048_04340 [Pedobacter polaris]|uniref:Uncharacterized protein n=1 Tax=Pedobacter polaris TaxID=2571273 RepID=A0A4U1CUE0_9SPHI|nr:hypothetical protein [Pedobacter polaris]TKC12851.1 hypothetical protein FA048_04340 [Pedobacter polaris]